MEGLLNTANLITVSRIILVLPTIYFILSENVVGSVIFLVMAMITDWLDGFIARKQNLTTDYGKLLDPAADKIFTISILTAFVEKHYTSSYLVYLLITREMLITWLRSVKAKKGITLSASNEGKVKTTLQFIAMLLLSLKLKAQGNIILILSIIVAYYSAFQYLFYIFKIKKYK